MTARAPEVRIRDRAVAGLLPAMPRRLVRRLSAPYIAGEHLDDALETIDRLRAGGLCSTLDVLGEAVTDAGMAQHTREEYLQALDRLATIDDANFRNVSVKPTGLGLAFDVGVARDYLRAIVQRASDVGGFVRIDMEDSPYTDITLTLFEELRAEGFDCVGVVIQAYLKRSEADVERLAAMRAPVRIVKGIYLEPATIAFHDMQKINDSFVELSERLVASGSRVAFATHDERLVRESLEIVRRHALQPDQYEFQMLLGVREAMRDELVRDGHPVRVYVPYGAQWYEYSLRRLRENPKIAGYVAGDVARSLGRRLKPGRRRAPAASPRGAARKAR